MTTPRGDWVELERAFSYVCAHLWSGRTFSPTATTIATEALRSRVPSRCKCPPGCDVVFSRLTRTWVQSGDSE
jgi:hypothetical protein